MKMYSALLASVLSIGLVTSVFAQDRQGGRGISGLTCGGCTVGKLPVITGAGTFGTSGFGDPGSTGILATLSSTGGIGFAAPGFVVTSSAVNAMLVAGPSTGNFGSGQIELDSYNNGAALNPSLSFYSSRGVAGAPTAIQSGDVIGAIYYGAYGATGYQQPNNNLFEFLAAENFTDAASAIKVNLWTTDTVSETQKIRFSVDGNGNTNIENGHLGFVNLAPALSACGGGSPSLDATASDTAGTVTEGTSATGCTVTFATPFASVPHVIASSPSGLAALTYTVTASHIVFTNTSTSGGTISYAAFQ